MFRIEEVRKNKRAGLFVSPFAVRIAATALVLTMVLGPSTGSASRLPTPENFRVTAQTAYTVTVAWNPPRNNQGNFNYYLSGAYGVTPAILPRTATSHTFTRLHSGNEYWFFIYARDAGGNTSGTVSATTRTLHDTTPPSTGPAITVTEVGSNYVSVSLTPAQDDCPFLVYQVSVNGNPHTELSPNLSTTLRFLSPATTYTLTARGRDEGNFWSPFSAPVNVTTLPPNPNDHTPPNTPANLSAYGFGDGSTEMQIQWAQSTDDFDAHPISVTMFTSTAPWRMSASVPAARSPLTAYSEKTRSKSPPPTQPAIHRRRPLLQYSFR
jgi:fibronectin type III domain protein